MSFDIKLFEWDRLYINPLHGRHCCPSVDFPRRLALYGQGNLRLDEMMTRTCRLAELGRARPC